MKKYLKVFILTICMLSLISAPVFAAQPNKPSKEELDRRYKQIQDIMIKAYKKQISMDDAEKELKKINATLVKNQTQVGALYTDPEFDMSLYTPNVIHDDLTHHWFASA